MKRRQQRGAAMVEAAVVLPVLICMLGLSMMTRNAYSTKIQANQGIRNSVLANASNNCEGGTSGSSSIDPNAGAPAGGGGTGGPSQNLAQVPGGSSATSGIMQTYSQNYSATSVDNPKPNTATNGTGLQIPIKSQTSYALCNEKKMGGGFSGFFGYLGSVLKSLI